MNTFYMRFPGGLERAMTLSYDDGVETDARLIDILDRNGLYATFNINSGSFAPEGTVYPAGTIHRRMSRSRSLALYTGSRHEVALHASHHPFLERLPLHVATREVLCDRMELEQLFGRVVRGMAYPFGTTNDGVVDCLRCCGIVYSRTTVSTHGFNMPQDWLRMPATCHHNDPALFELLDTFLSPLGSNRPPRLFYLWGHSYEFDGNDNWDRIEKFASLAGGRDDVWYATNIDIYDYTRDYERLNFSVDCTIVENPTSREIWFSDAGGNIHSVAPGETKRL